MTNLARKKETFGGAAFLYFESKRLNISIKELISVFKKSGIYESHKKSFSELISLQHLNDY